MLNPSLMLLMVMGGLQTAINYGVMGFTPSLLIARVRPVGGRGGRAVRAAVGRCLPPLARWSAGPLTDWLGAKLGGKGMVLLVLAALSISPFFGIWTYSAATVSEFYFRFVIYSLILTLWLPPTYTLILGLVLPRMRGMMFSTYLIIMTLLGQGLGPYAVGIVSDRNGGDLGQAMIAVNWVVPGNRGAAADRAGALPAGRGQRARTGARWRRECLIMVNVREASFAVFAHFGVDRLFGNPGSTELPMLKAMPFPYVMGLNEAVVMGMADGYARELGQAGAGQSATRRRVPGTAWAICSPPGRTTRRWW